MRHGNKYKVLNKALDEYTEATQRGIYAQVDEKLGKVQLDGYFTFDDIQQINNILKSNRRKST